jgi:hypothetical protein
LMGEIFISPMDILSRFNTQDILTYSALVLAYLAYRNEAIKEYRHWLDLVKAFSKELAYAKHWLGTGYTEREAAWKDSSKLVFPLSFESVKAMISKGHPPKTMFPDEYFNNLVIFNERLAAFNQLTLAQIYNFVQNGSVSEEEFVNNKDNNLISLHINDTLHRYIIGNEGESHLHNHYVYFTHENQLILRNGLKSLPVWTRYPIILQVVSLILFLILEVFLAK